MSNSLEFTGERFTPECVREIWYEHFHRYVFARNLVKGRRVLDAACGEGYGSALISKTASSVSAVDMSEAAVAHAKARYSEKNLEFLVSDCRDLPFDDNEFDVIVSFETLEHLEDHQGMMTEFRRVLKPEGFLLLSSPDKAVYTDQLQNQNEYHVRELYRDELETLIRQNFPAYRLWGQKLLFQSAIWSLEEAPGVVFQQESAGQVEDYPVLHHPAVYFLALCAADESCLPSVGHGISLFDDASESVYEHYYHEIRKHIAAGELLAERDRELAELRLQLEQIKVRSSWWSRLLGGK